MDITEAIRVTETRDGCEEKMEEEEEAASELSLPDAITYRYFEQFETRHFGISVSQSPPGKTMQNGLMVPRMLALDDCGISHAGDPAEVHRLCSHVREMDLCRNAFQGWDQICTIVSQMPSIDFLNVSQNSLTNLPLTISEPLVQNSSLTKLALNSTGTSWETVNKLLWCFPTLEELYLNMNGYEDVRLDDDLRIDKLRCLHFIDNRVKDWDQILRFTRAFPNLKKLVMSGCLIDELGDAGTLAQCFPELEFLNLNRTKLESWSEIEKINSMPSLKHVRLKLIPLTEALPSKLSRQMLIVHLPAIELLNGSDITENEREDAERIFLRHYMDVEEKPARYAELEEKHGKLDPLADVNLAPSRRVDVYVIYDEKRLKINIDLYKTVLDLKKRLQDFTGLRASKMILYYFDVEFLQELGPVEMRISTRQLYTYHVHQNDEIFVEPKIT